MSHGTRNVAQVARDLGVRMVHCCHSDVFRQSPLDSLDETRARVPRQDPAHPAYDQSKAEGERAVRALIAEGLDATILHPTGTTLGPHDYGCRGWGMCSQSYITARCPA